MKGKHLAVLILLVAALCGAWYLLTDQHSGAWSETGGGGRKILQFQPNDVTRVLIKNAEEEVNLERKGDAWTVKERANYPANFEEIDSLLRQLWDLKTVQEVKVGASQLARLDLVQPSHGDKSATLVQLDGANGNPLAALLVGKQYLRQNPGGSEPGGAAGFPAGRYVKPTAKNAPVSLVSETFSEVVPKPERWVAKDFIKVQEPSAISVTDHWKLSRESVGAPWVLADAKPEEKVDASKTSVFNNILSGAVFTDVQPSDAKLEDPVTIANIDTFAGFHYELRIGKTIGESYPLQVKVSADLSKDRTSGTGEKPEDKARLDGEFATRAKANQEKLDREKGYSARIYLIGKNAVDELLKPRADLLSPPPAASTALPSPTAPSQPLSVTTPAVSVPLRR